MPISALALVKCSMSKFLLVHSDQISSNGSQGNYIEGFQNTLLEELEIKLEIQVFGLRM